MFLPVNAAGKIPFFSSEKFGFFLSRVFISVLAQAFSPFSVQQAVGRILIEHVSLPCQLSRKILQKPETPFPQGLARGKTPPLSRLFFLWIPPPLIAPLTETAFFFLGFEGGLESHLSNNSPFECPFPLLIPS